jgi:hypothetical protein
MSFLGDEMANKIPNSVIGAVSSVIGQHYYRHSKINSLLMESGAPGNPPDGNCEAKINLWLRRCNDDLSVDALLVLGQVIQPFMDTAPYVDGMADGQKRISESLAKNQLNYQVNGYVMIAGASPVAKSLSAFFNSGDFASINAEFDRTLSQLERDPHAAITAASSIIEALCKTYIDTLKLGMPSDQSIAPLWKTVRTHLGLNFDPTLNGDQLQIIQGLTSIIQGVGGFRTHIGSAHGRGVAPPQIHVSEARLAVNAAHTIVSFVMERWHGSVK